MVAAKASILLVIVSLLAFGGNVDAALGDALKGQNPIELIVEDLHEGATKCWISRDSLEAAMRIPLSNSPIKVREGLLPYLYVNVNALKMDNGGCAVSVEVSFHRWMFTSRSSSADGDMATVWSKGELLTGPSTDMGRRIANKVEDLTKTFIGAWLKAND